MTIARPSPTAAPAATTGGPSTATNGHAKASVPAAAAACGPVLLTVVRRTPWVFHARVVCSDGASFEFDSPLELARWLGRVPVAPAPSGPAGRPRGLR